MWWKDKPGATRRRRFVSAVAIVALLGVVVPLAAAGGVPVLRDFEDLATGAAVFDQYDGVVFEEGNNTNFDGSHRFTVVEPSAGTVSPTRALRAHIDRACEFCGTVMEMAVAEGQYRVSLSTGLADACPSCTAGFTMLMQGYDKDPAVVGSGASLITSKV